MSRFVLHRSTWVTFLVIGQIVASTIGGTSIAHADSWADLLKPLVKDVLVPGASMGMKKLIQHVEQKHGVSKESANFASSSSNDFSSSADKVSSQAGSGNSSSEFSLQEEPGSQSSSLTEEPTQTASSGDDALSSPPPPPPPVATP